MIRHSAIIVLCASLAALSGCASTHHQPYAYGGSHRNALTGAAIGAAGGALVGHAVDDGGRGALVGGALGAMAGAGIGYHLDKKRDREAYGYRQAPQYDGRAYRQPSARSYPDRY